MSYKTIVAVVQGEHDEERVLDCALALAGRFKSHVIGVHSEPMPIAYTSSVGMPDAEFVYLRNEANGQRSAALGEQFSRRAAESGVSAEWRSMENLSGDSALSAIGSARAADLVVAAQADADSDPVAKTNLEAILFESGRPLLFVPAAAPCQSSFRKVLIAWNGSREAARAVADALPFIMDADEVDVLVVDADRAAERSRTAAGRDLVAGLERHGVSPRLITQRSEGQETADVIQNYILETQPDLVVMGAYSHSWLREFLFGGVTRSVLASMPVATFMSR